MKKILRFASPSTIGFVLALGALNACGQPPTSTDNISDQSLAQKAAVLKACHLDDGTVDADADVRACDPQDDKKATICHLPPGNPANAHTLCIGKPAVAAHLRNHGDYLGPCKAETLCPPPPSAPDAGTCRPRDNGDRDQGRMQTCHLDDGSVENDADVHACDPKNDKKTTICHLLPGNPANAHTLCIGNAAVQAHLSNHHDHVGACENEMPCPPPAGMGGETCVPGTGGAPGAGGAPGGEGTGGAPGATGGTSGQGTGGAGGTGGTDVIIV